MPRTEQAYKLEAEALKIKIMKKIPRSIAKLEGKKRLTPKDPRPGDDDARGYDVVRSCKPPTAPATTAAAATRWAR